MGFKGGASIGIKAQLKVADGQWARESFQRTMAVGSLSTKHTIGHT